MKLSDIIRLLINPVTGYEIDPAELVPNGKWVEVNENEYEQRGLVKDIIGTSIRMRQLTSSKYKVNVFVNTDGSGEGVINGTTIGSGEYYPGEAITIGAIANDGFEFTHWQDGSTQNPRNIRVISDMDFVANFRRERSTYTVDVMVYPGHEGYGTVSGGGTDIQYGEDITISAVPNTGYLFDRWTDGNRNATRTIHVIGDQTFIAKFKPKTCEIVVTSNNPRKGRVFGGGTYDIGQQITIRAIPYDGYIFQQWNDGSTEATRNIMVSGDATYIATFADTPQTVATICIKSYNEIMGRTNPEGSYVYQMGSTQRIQAIANNGYRFTRWSDGNTQAERDITITGNATYVAYFERITTQYYTLGMNCSPRGAGTVQLIDRESIAFPEGTELHILATPNSGFTFAGWLINGEEDPETGRIITFNINQNTIVTALFEQIPEPPKYTILVNCVPEDGGEISGDGQYPAGWQCELTARPAAGYHFVNWEENGTPVSSEEYYVFTVDDDRELDAVFEENTEELYDVGIVVVTDGNQTDSRGGTVSGTGAREYRDGENCELTARAARGYDFVGWVFNDIASDPISRRASYRFAVTEDTQVYAKFITHVVNTYSVSTGFEGESYGAVITGDGDYNEGDLVTVSVDLSSAEPGCSVIGWVVNDLSYEASGTSYTFTIRGNMEVYAVLDRPSQFTVNTGVNPDGGGTVTGGGVYEYGDSCTLTAIPNEGYRFVSWGDIYGSGNPITFVVHSDRNMVANFTEITPSSFTVVATPDPAGGGSITGAGVYGSGARCSLVATPNEGYVFKNWTINGGVVSTSLQYMFNVDCDKTIIAHFERMDTGYTVTTVVQTNGTLSDIGGSISGNSSPYEQGETCTLTAIPNEGYIFNGWIIDGDENSERMQPTYSFEVEGDITIVAKFVEASIPFTVTTKAMPVEGGTVSGGGQFSEGAQCTLMATPNTGYVFDHWMINGEDDQQMGRVPNPYVFNVTEDVEAVAVFNSNS